MNSLEKIVLKKKRKDTSNIEYSGYYSKNKGVSSTKSIGKISLNQNSSLKYDNSTKLLRSTQEFSKTSSSGNLKHSSPTSVFQSLQKKLMPAILLEKSQQSTRDKQKKNQILIRKNSLSRLLYRKKSGEIDQLNIGSSINYERIATPKQRSQSETTPGYSETIPIKEYADDNKKSSKIEFSKCLPLEIYDPIIEMITPKGQLEHQKAENPTLSAFSKWFFGNGTYEWRSCNVESYDEQKEQYLIVWPNGVTKLVSRLNLRFANENEKEFEERISEAKKYREDSEISLRYNFFIINNPINPPHFSTMLIDNILKYVQGMYSSDLLKYRNQDIASKYTISFKYNPQRFLWKNESTHIIDETLAIRVKNYPSHSEYLKKYLNKTPLFKLLSFPTSASPIKRDILLRLTTEVEEDWKTISKHLDFDAKHKEAIENSIFCVKLKNSNLVYRDSLSLTVPKLTPCGFMPLFIELKQGSFLNDPVAIKIIQKIQNTILSLDNFSIFPSSKFEKIEVSSFIEAYSSHSEAFFQEIRGAIFDSQCDIREILTKEDQKRIQRNNIKLKGRTHNKQIIELELALPEELVNFTRRLVKVCNTKIEDRIRECLNRSLKTAQQRFEVATGLLNDSSKDGFDEDDLEIIKGYCSKFLNIGLFVDVKDEKVAVTPQPAVFKEKIISFINKILKKLSEVKCITTTQTGPARQNYFLAILEINSEEYLETMDTLERNLDFQFKLLDAFIKRIEPYYFCITLNPAEFATEFKRKTNEEIENEIFRLKRNEIEICEVLSKENGYLGIWVINGINVQNHLIDNIEKVIQVLYTVLLDDSYAKLKQINLQYNEVLSVISHTPKNIEELDDIKKYIQKNYDLKIEFIESELTSIFSNLEILEDYKYYINFDLYDKSWKCFGYCPILDQTKEKSLEIIVVLLANFTAKISEERVKLFSDIEAILEKLNLLKKEDSFEDQERVSIEYNILKNELQDTSEKSKLINSRELLIEESLSDFKVLEEIKREFTPYCKLWFFIRDFVQRYPTWMSEPIGTLNRDSISTEINSYTSEVAKMEKGNFKENPAAVKLCKDLLERVNNFKPYIPIIRAFNNPGMKERHWNDIQQRAKLKVSLNKNTSLQVLIDGNIMDYLELLESTSDLANKEMTLENAKRKMENDWNGINLELSDFKGSYILVNTEGIWDTLNEQLMKTMAMLASPYIAFIINEMNTWKNNLTKMQDTLEIWENFQRNWQYLQPIFSSNDISRQLPQASTKFRTINNQWESIMSTVVLNPIAIDCCVNMPKIFDIFKNGNEALEGIVKNLNEYLLSKRRAFPRFYFLSNEELVQILSNSQDIISIQKYIVKCFEAISSVIIEDKKIVGMTSPEGEKVRFNKPIEFYIGNEIKSIELWMNDIEVEMISCLRDQLVQATNNWSLNLKLWVSSWPSQLIHASLMAIWTHGTEESIYENNLKEFYNSQEGKLHKLVEIVRGNLNRLERLTFSTMVVLDVHNKDIIENLILRNVVNLSDFAWFCNMRFYLDDGIMKISMLDCVREYGYEYLGNQNRLIITALTDRCYRTLMSALEMSLGGAPEGPAGTGKTETVKDLAKSIAKKCVVFNCSDRLDHLYMAKFFTGLCYCGAWACFDEFNRIELEVLSVIAEQILSIQTAVQRKAPSFNMDNEEVKLNPSCAVFITMNPDYAGRSKLPDNLKALFRPVAMMVPDYSMIAEIFLYSFGFRDARNLARKIVNSLKLASEQLSTQPHYDYGMRAVSTIINAAGRFKQADPTKNESVLVLKAIKSTNIPKFLAQDIPLFNGIVVDLFPGVIEEEASESELALAISEAMDEEMLTSNQKFLEKALEIYRTALLRHGLMIVGETMSGKTKAIKCLSKALMKKSKVEVHIINPKSIIVEQLYGAPDPVSQDWKDGVLAQGIRKFCDNLTEGYQWIVLDGPVDAKWIESMNTVMDDNKKLCLSSGEIIKLTLSIRMMFEVDDLSQASPATVSRCGMIYMDPDDILGPMSLISSWIKCPPRPFGTIHNRALFENLFTSIFIPCVEYWKINIKPQMPIACSIGHATKNTLKIFQSLILKKNKSRKQHESELAEEPKNMISKQNSSADLSSPTKPNLILNVISKDSLVQEVIKVINPEELKKEDDRFTSLLIVAIQWGLGGPCTEDGRRLCNKKIHDVAKDILQLPENLDDYYYNDTEKNWVSWNSIIVKPSKEVNVTSILVPTISLVSYTFLLNELLTRKENILVTGDTGTGKTVLINSILMKLDKAYAISSTMFSARSNCTETQTFIESGIMKRRKGFYGPESGKFRIFLIDDLNMPAKEEYGAQTAIELLRIALERNEIYDRANLELKVLEDIQCIGSMGHPGGGRSTISLRFTSKCILLNFTNYSTSSLFLIINTMLNIGLCNHASTIVEAIDTLSNAIVKVYTDVISLLPPTPTKSHYTFNLRDLFNIVKGIFLSPPSKLNRLNTLHRLWVHECFRAFADRLIDLKDNEVLNKILEDALVTIFKVKWKDAIGKEVIFSNCLEDKLYQECTSPAKLKQCLENYLEDYNNENSVKMNLLIFDFAIEHITRISRILATNNGNLLLVGVGGSGRMSLTKLCAFFLKMNVFQIKLTKTYGILEWSEDLKNVLKSAGQDEKKIVFILRDSEIIMEVFLESINNILNSGQAPNLFSTDEIQGIIETMRMNKNYSMMNEQQRWENFNLNVKKNLHIAMCMMPQGEVMRSRIRQFPSLVNCCTIDWFTEWPEQALAELAKFFLQEERITDNDEKLNSSIKICVNFHLSVRALSARYLQEYKRYNYVTPTHYLLLLRNLKNLYQHKEETIIKQKKKYSTGVNQLDQTQMLVKKMKEELTALKPSLENKTILVEETLKQIQEENIEADKTRNFVASEEYACGVQASIAEGIRKECQDALSKILPELESAIKSLDTIKKDDIDLVRTMHNPPEAVKITLEAIAIANKQKPIRMKDSNNPTGMISDYYESGKKLLSVPKFIERLKNFDRNSLDDEIISKISPYIVMPKFHPEIVKYASSAAEGMCKWVRAMYKFYHVNRDIKPKQDALMEADTNVQEKKELLKIKQAELVKIEQYIESLNKELEIRVAEKNELISEIKAVEIKLGRAIKLIDQIGGERESWSDKVKIYSADSINILGDVLLSAAVVSYMGPFILIYREIAIQQNWLPYFDSIPEIPYTKNYSLVTVIGEPAALQKWAICGLPSDKVSIENALIIQYTLNWPLIIDPQGQASKWLKKTFEQLKINAYKIKLESSNFMSVLENALFMGSTLIIEDIKESIDPVLDPLLLKQWYQQDSMNVIKIGDSIKEYDVAFKLYLLSNLSNPHFSPEVSTKVTLLNFTITEEGLAEQLLDLICRKELPKDTQDRDQLIIQVAEYTRNMQIFEDKILSMLQTGGNTILDNEELINSLTESKLLSIELGKKLDHARHAEQRIFSIQSNYIPAAKLSSVLYFCVADLVNIDFMYQYSMGWFIYIFKKALADADIGKDTTERVKKITLKFRELLYSAIYTSLNEDDKSLFAFLISIRLQMFEKAILAWHWKYFLTGLCGFAEPKQNLTNFLSDKAWREVLQLDLQYKGITEHILQNQDEWIKFASTDKVYINLPNFDELTQILPKPYNNETMIIRLLLFRALKPENLGIAVKAYIKTILGEKYLTPIIFNLASIYKETSPFKPLIFVLTPGTDPQSMIKRYTSEIGVTLVAASLGKGQGGRAEKIIRDCSIDGKWVLLQNCHLAISWLPRLELLLEELASPTEKMNVHKNFRLTLTASPTPNFPVNILKKSVKAISQLPSALCSSLLGIYSGISESKEESAFYASSKKPDYWRKLFFSLCFFHCVIRERSLFGPIGWNNKYEFGESDFRISSRQLMQMLNDFNEPPFEALIHITAECNYGGKVTDDWDRRILKILLETFYNSEMLKDTTTSVISVEGYCFPVNNELPIIATTIKSFPQVQIPEIFGLHANAEISRSRKEAYDLCSRLLALQPQAVSTSYDDQKSSIIQLSNMILSKISATFNINKARESYPLSYYDSMNTVLIQELSRYNRLIIRITTTLKNIIKVYEGIILITDEYELLGQNMLKNKIPEMWVKFSYNSCKTLVSYVEDLKKRIEFLNLWIEKGRPQIFWISGIFFTQSFLTAILQEYARKNHLPIDTLNYSYEVVQEVNGHPEYGAYVNGLFLEGARWDGTQLAESLTRELIFQFPTVRYM